jgi:O-methyltransferase involved in polyketide biosynthesis
VLFDQQVRGFLRDHPQGTVVALGEGLETQLWRVDNGSVRWVSVDLPEMIDLRRRLLPAHPRNQLVACSALDPAWTDMAGPGTPVLIVAQGLLMYFTEADVDGFFEMVASRCPGSAVLFDTIPAWAATSTGHRQNRSYRMPPQPWGTGRRGVLRIGRRHRGIASVQILPSPRGRGLGWGVCYPATTRIPGLRGLLPQTVIATIRPPRS